MFARLYKQHSLEGGHVIKLGPGNDEAALEALSAWPGSRVLLSCSQILGLKKINKCSDSLQVGGGINDTNAKFWIDAGASKVEWIFFFLRLD